MKKEKTLPKIYVLDSETDPFKYKRKPKPFAWGLYSDDYWHYTWGKDCTKKMIENLYQLDAGLIFIHNGGRFDVFYLLGFLDKEKRMLIIKNRITVCWIKCHNGWHEIRDSYKILPFALSAYKKDEIDYGTFEASERNKPANKHKIIAYMQGDCRYTWTLCARFLERFGDTITIGSAATRELKRFHDIGKPLSDDADVLIRGTYFFGGRVQCFEKGVTECSIRVLDVNSMYPAVMRNFKHPIGEPICFGRQITKDTCFILVRGRNYGAFPCRTKIGLKFDIDIGTFAVTRHEWDTAERLGLFEPKEILQTVDFAETIDFAEYIDHYYASRKEAIEAGDDIYSLFYKFLLNNSYGRFAINPENYKDYKLTDSKTFLEKPWTPSEVIEDFGLIFWSMGSKFSRRSNVATGASITGAARSVLMEGLHGAVRPLYCDTDCIICEKPGKELEINPSKLGAWKLEKTGNRIAIYGRKGYALWDGVKCVKYASKGVKLTPAEILAAAQGETITYYQDAPSFKLDGSVQFIKRDVRLT